MRVTFRMPDCDDWTDEDLDSIVEHGHERPVKVTEGMRWDKMVTNGRVVAAVRDGHDALITLDLREDADHPVMEYLRRWTGRQEFSIGPHVTVETTGNGPEVPGACGFTPTRPGAAGE